MAALLSALLICSATAAPSRPRKLKACPPYCPNSKHKANLFVLPDYLKNGVLNGLFVLGRSIGLIAHYLDQKRVSLFRVPQAIEERYADKYFHHTAENFAVSSPMGRYHLSPAHAQQDSWKRRSCGSRASGVMTWVTRAWKRWRSCTAHMHR